MSIGIIAETINSHTAVVDQWLLDRLDAEYKKGSYSKRKNVDALALELTMLKAGKIRVLDKVEGESYQWRHDWALNLEYLIDLKRRPQWSHKVTLSDIGKFINSFEIGQLTHFVAYNQNIEHDYKIGDLLTFKFDGMIDVRNGIKLANRRGEYRLLTTELMDQI
jgi:hypothetical protein